MGKIGLGADSSKPKVLYNKSASKDKPRSEKDMLNFLTTEEMLK